MKATLRIAVVEDKKNDSEKLKSFVSKYCTDNNLEYKVSCFFNGVEFLDEIRKNSEYDIVFLDIEMPLMNGMECAERLRKTGNDCCLLFVTNMVQYAIQGYEVDAKGYVLKPISYVRFEREMHRVTSIVKAKQRDDWHITINTSEGKKVIVYSTIKYIEVKGHNSIIYTENGDFVTRKPLGEIEKTIDTPSIARCSNAYMVNLKFIDSINGSVITLLDGQTLTISRGKKEEFIKKFIGYTRR